MKCWIVTFLFLFIGVGIVTYLILQLNSVYAYLKNSMEWMSYSQNDYSVSSLQNSSDEIISWYCYLNGQEAMKSNSSLNSLCSKYLDYINQAWIFQFIIPGALVLLNYLYQFGYPAFKSFYRFSSVRTENLIVWFQIYISMVIVNIMIPLIGLSSQYTEPTRGFYLITGPMYSIFIILTTWLLPIEKFGYWLLISCIRKIKRRKWVIQKELEDTLRRKQFDFTHKIPYLLGLLTIVMFFVGGIPIIIVIFMFYFLVYFWIEKAMILKFYRKPIHLEETALRFSDYCMIVILTMHLFNSIIMYGTADIFPIDTVKVDGVRKGYSTSYYIPKPQSFIEKFGNQYNVMFLILLILILIFLILAFIFRNKLWWRKFKYFPMSYRFKMNYK